MTFEMRMPDLATTGSEIRVIRWIAAAGDRVKRGQPLLEVETDKATMEVESTVAGVLVATVAAVDQLVAAGQVIATLDVAESTGVTTIAPPVRREPPAAVPIARAPADGKPGGMFARNRAAAGAPPGAATGVGVVLSPAHRTAARRLQESKQTVPHFYLQTSFNAKGIIARRKEAAAQNIAWDAFFVHAVAKAMKRFGHMGMRLDSDRLVPAPSDSIGVAVDANGDLFVIPVNDPAGRTVEAVSNDIRALAERLRAGDASARRLPQVAITITNLGSCNVESFVPIINSPEAAILGIGKVMPTCIARDTRIAIEPRATLTLAVDHRVVNGKYAGDFLGAIATELESFGPIES